MSALLMIFPRYSFVCLDTFTLTVIGYLSRSLRATRAYNFLTPSCLLFTQRMFGAVEAFDELERDIEDIRVLAFNGSSVRLLDHLLTPFAVIPGIA